MFHCHRATLQDARGQDDDDLCAWHPNVYSIDCAPQFTKLPGWWGTPPNVLRSMLADDITDLPGGIEGFGRGAPKFKAWLEQKLDEDAAHNWYAPERWGKVGNSTLLSPQKKRVAELGRTSSKYETMVRLPNSMGFGVTPVAEWINENVEKDHVQGIHWDGDGLGPLGVDHASVPTSEEGGNMAEPC